MSKWYAQSGEDKMLVRIFRKIRTTNRVAVEFGAADGYRKSNTAYFRDHGWCVRQFDIEPAGPLVIEAGITAGNVNAVFASAGIPQHFDLLSIDVDGNDLWIWQALRYQPRVVVIEYNPRWGPRASRTVPYDPARRWDGTNFYGASALALTRLGVVKGYDLVASTRSNLIFVLAGWYPALKPSQIPRASKTKRPDPLHRKWELYV